MLLMTQNIKSRFVSKILHLNFQLSKISLRNFFTDKLSSRCEGFVDFLDEIRERLRNEEIRLKDEVAETELKIIHNSWSRFLRNFKNGEIHKFLKNRNDRKIRSNGFSKRLHEIFSTESKSTFFVLRNFKYGFVNL